MKQAKKVFTRMCLNNWGGIGHQVLKFHEYVNLFSGKSGSGKSTVMDAIQVLLYGSFSPVFLNKAADDAKNRRSVLSYLRGEQKDGSANREGQDFCSTLALEIEDTGTHIVTCIGIAFEVHRNDSEIKKFVYFSHSGKMPEGEYVDEEGCPYTNRRIKKLVEERAQSKDNRGRGEVNRIYPSKEAYRNTLYDVILGYIDGNRFCTMEKSAIALRMSNGTGQFIRDYMFPKSTADTIERISEQLGAYRDIKEKIEDLEKRIVLLSEVKKEGQELVRVRADIVRAKSVLRCIDIADSRSKIEAWEEQKKNLETEMEVLKQAQAEWKEKREKTDTELIKVKADLQTSDLGSKREYLSELTKRSKMLSEDSEQWRKIIRRLRQWEEDEIVTDYISNPLLNQLSAFGRDTVTEEQCRELHRRISEEKENIEAEFDNYNEQKRATGKELKEKQKLVEDIRNNRKSYSESLKTARSALERRLREKCGASARVRIFADLFDVKDEEWKNAVEGRMGRLKLSLITEPQYAHQAAVLFRQMKEFEEIDLIDSAAVIKSSPQILENSLYEAVETKESYVDACLKRYLGHISKCHSVDELENVRDGVTPDCYSYSNFIFRHLRKKDYTLYACIGSKVSKSKLSEYETDVQKLEKEYSELVRITEGLKAAMRFECLEGEPKYFSRLSHAGKDLMLVMKEKAELEQEIRTLEEGKYRELQERERILEKKRDEIQGKLDENQTFLNQKIGQKGRVEGDIVSESRRLEERMEGYIPNVEIEQEVKAALEKRSAQFLKNQKNSEMDVLCMEEEQREEKLRSVRNQYIFAYPSCGFNGSEKSNGCYEELLERYRSDFEPKYQAEFDRQCNLIYKSLRGNVIATIHGDIKAAKRHTLEINRLLRETNFSDSTYQIKIEPAKNENGQFYDMLMAEELDSKTLDDGGYDGQMSLGEDLFYQKYEQKINLLIEKFMPLRETEEHLIEQKRREMERYADYRNYLSFSMFEQITDEKGHVIRENPVDEMAGRDSGGEGQNPKYVALLAGFAMLYMQQSNRDSRIKLVLLDEAFSKMDQERSAVCLKYARKMNLQLIVCVPDERLQSLIRNVDCVYGFRRYQNQISMMHIDKGDYLELMEGNHTDE